MNTTEPDAFSLRLTAELAQSIFPVAPRDRRENKDLFAPFVAEDRLRDDTAFYAGLVRMILGDGIDQLRRYDGRMHQRNDWRKAFGLRGLRYLMNLLPGEFKAGEIVDLPLARFTDFPGGQAVHDLLKRLRNADGTQVGTETDSVEVNHVAPQKGDWPGLAREIAAAAQGMESPDQDLAARVLALAEALVESCRIAAEAEAATAGLSRRAEALRDRLAALDPGRAENWPETVTAETLDRIDGALGAAEDSLTDRMAAQQALEDVEARAALTLAARRFDETARMLAECTDAKTRLELELVAEEAAMQELDGLLSSLGSIRAVRETEVSTGSEVQLGSGPIELALSA